MENIAWPNQKRVAVIVSVLLETWAEGKSPTYFPRTTPLKAGTPDLPGRQWSQFGSDEGVWRILNVLDRTGVRSTVFANALSVETYPQLVAEIVRGGHDIGGTATRRTISARHECDAQQQTIRRCADVIEAGTRIAPKAG